MSFHDGHHLSPSQQRPGCTPAASSRSPVSTVRSTCSPLRTDVAHKTVSSETLLASEPSQSSQSVNPDRCVATPRDGITLRWHGTRSSRKESVHHRAHRHASRASVRHAPRRPSLLRALRAVAARAARPCAEDGPTCMPPHTHTRPLTSLVAPVAPRPTTPSLPQALRHAWDDRRSRTANDSAADTDTASSTQTAHARGPRCRPRPRRQVDADRCRGRGHTAAPTRTQQPRGGGRRDLEGRSQEDGQGGRGRHACGTVRRGCEAA